MGLDAPAPLAQGRANVSASQRRGWGGARGGAREIRGVQDGAVKHGLENLREARADCAQGVLAAAQQAAGCVGGWQARAARGDPRQARGAKPRPLREAAGKPRKKKSVSKKVARAPTMPKLCSIPRTPTLKVLAAQQDLAIFVFLC
eukprot:scaffold65219_cov60-Phaeocystis_antarctica.AAC.1